MTMCEWFVVTSLAMLFVKLNNSVVQNFAGWYLQQSTFEDAS